MTGTDSTAVFIKVPVDDVVAAVLDAPVRPVGFEYLLSIGLVWCSAGNAIGKFDRALACFLVDALAFDQEGLADVGEVEVIVQCGGRPDPSSLDASVRNGRAVNEIRVLSILEMEDDVVQEIGLVAFDGEVIMCLPVLNQIGSERALRQQRIGSCSVLL